MVDRHGGGFPGGTHAPHHPTREWIKKISDLHLFDKSWDDLRVQILANQNKLGVIPHDAKVTPWPHDLRKHWDELTPNEKQMYLRQADVFAAYVVHTDHDRSGDPGGRRHGQTRQHFDHLRQRRQRH